MPTDHSLPRDRLPDDLPVDSAVLLDACEPHILTDFRFRDTVGPESLNCMVSAATTEALPAPLKTHAVDRWNAVWAARYRVPRVARSSTAVAASVSSSDTAF